MNDPEYIPLYPYLERQNKLLLSLLTLVSERLEIMKTEITVMQSSVAQFASVKAVPTSPEKPA